MRDKSMAATAKRLRLAADLMKAGQRTALHHSDLDLLLRNYAEAEKLLESLRDLLGLDTV